MTIQLDVSRLDRVAEVLGRPVPELVAGIVTNLTDGIERLRTHVERGEVELAAEAAHTCRNEVMLIAAQPLLPALTEVEQAARAGRVDDAQAAYTVVEEVWPATERALAEIASRPQ